VRPPDLAVTSLTNPRVKEAVRLRQRSHRDEQGLMLVEGFRELKRALDNGYRPSDIFYCESLFLKGTHEPDLVERARAAGAQAISCTAEVFAKLAYRDRPEGLLAVGPQLRRSPDDLHPADPALVIVAQAIEKPGNLGTILRSADAAGVHAVLVCDRCTDLHNPNVVRASLGTLFSVPVAECDTASALAFCRRHGCRILAASPHAERLHTEADLAAPVAIVVGTEQYGLSDAWMSAADLRVRIPMLGQADSLNVASATTILLYEAVRQRLARGLLIPPPPGGAAQPSAPQRASRAR
jgi:TrmH family RNA methyltransferase